MGPDMINIAPILMGCAMDTAGQSKKETLNTNARNVNANLRDAISTSFGRMGGWEGAG